MIRKIRTVGDVRDEKKMAEWPSIIKADLANKERDRIQHILATNPQIGELCRNGKRVFYTNNPYRESYEPAGLI